MESQDHLVKYLNQWSLSNPARLATSATSEVFKVKFQGHPAILKILTQIGSEDESSGATALRYYDGVGAASVFLADEHAHLIEFVGVEDLKGFMNSNGDNLALSQLISVVRKLHSKRSNAIPSGLRDLRRRFRSLFQLAHEPNCDGETKDAALIAHELLSSEQNVGLLHGDLHYENVLLSPERGWVAIDPKGLIGELTFDLANTFYNPMSSFEQIRSKHRITYAADAFRSELGFEDERILQYAFVYGHLSASWMKEVGSDPQPTLEIASVIRKLL
jgi:streptomycin 6-kinase